MSNFFEELKKRNVYKTATAYAVTSWLILQIVDVIGPGLGWSESFTALLLKILVVGFPISLVLAWVYEITPQGFKRTGKVQLDTPDNRRTGRRLNYLIIGSLSLIIIFLLIDKLFISGPVMFKDQEQASIGVIPFRYISDQQDKAWMASGLAEDVYNEITKIRGIRAPRIPASSDYITGAYDHRKLAELNQLNYLLETDFQLYGDSFTLTTRLRNTATDMIVWTQRFPGKLNELQDIRLEMPRVVARQVKTRISDEQQTDLRDPEAYELYLRALDSARFNNVKRIKKSIAYLEEAVAIDSGFAQAYARLALQYRQLTHSGDLPRDEMAQLMKENLDKAMNINSELPEVYLAKGRYQAGIERDVEAATASYHKAIELQPGNADAHSNLAYIYRVYYRDPAKAYHHMKQAFDLDKTKVNGIAEYTYLVRRDYKEALRMLDISSSQDLTVNNGFQRKSYLITYEPYGDKLGGFKIAFDQYLKDPYERIHLNTLIPLLLDLDLAPFAERLVKRMLQMYPENMHTFWNARQYNEFTKKYNDNLDMIRIWDDKNSLPVNKPMAMARALLLSGDYNRAKDTLEKAFPMIKDPVWYENLAGDEQPLNYFHVDLIDSYVYTLLYLQQYQVLKQISDSLCKAIYFEIEGNPFLRFDDQYWMEETCLISKRQHKDLITRLNNLYFDRKHKGELFRFIRSGFYSFLEEYSEFQDLKRRITEDTHAMRADAIAYIKEHGEWDPAWDKELGLD